MLTLNSNCMNRFCCVNATAEHSHGGCCGWPPSPRLKPASHDRPLLITIDNLIRHTTPIMINIRFQDNRAVPRSRHCNRIDPRNCFPSVCCVHACMVDVAVVRLPPSPRLKRASHARLVLITIKIVDVIIHESCFDNTVACEYHGQNKKHNKE